MPDPVVLLRVTAVSAAVAAAVAFLLPLLAGRLWRSPGRAPVILGQALGTGAAFFVGALLLGASFQWPPKEDQDRFLLLLLPAAVLVESVAAFFPTRWWLVWLLRLPVAALAARVLLHAPAYLTGDAGTREWSAGQAALVLGGLSAALLLVWGALDVLVRRERGTSVCLGVSAACAAAGVTVMLSGYLTGGQLGLPLAGALAGTAVTGWFLPGPGRETGSLAVGVIGLFSLLVVGRFFASLTTPHAGLLFLAPLLCWLPEVPPLRRFWAWTRGVLRVVLVAVPLAVVVHQAWEKHREESHAPSNPWEGTPKDYEEFEGSQQAP